MNGVRVPIASQGANIVPVSWTFDHWSVHDDEKKQDLHTTMFI